MMKKTNRCLSAAVALAAMDVAFSQGAFAAEEQVIQEVQITGSRIVRKDYVSSSPVATFDQDVIEGFGAVTVEETLNSMPQFIPGSSSQTIAIGGGGGATLNLRGLGPTRNLVLMDGRRLPTSTVFGEVDVNILPSVMLKNVEVLTGGASSVYGSEAISGVVNFQSADFFDGVKYSAEHGTSSESDGDKTDLSILFGTEGDGARAMFAFGKSERDKVRGRDRDWRINSVASSFIGQGAFRDDGSNPIAVGDVQAVFTGYGIADVSGIASADRLAFNDDGSLFTQGFSNDLVNYQGPSGDNTLFSITPGGLRMPVDGRQGDLIKPLDRTSVFGKAEFDLSESATLYGQLLYSDTETRGAISRNLSLFGPEGDRLTVSIDNPFIPADLAGLLALRPTPVADFSISKRFLGVPVRTHIEEFTTTQFVVGVKGELGFNDWTYDVYHTIDNVDSTESIPDLVLSSRVSDLLTAADGGASICAGGYNPFGLANEQSLSEECRNYIAPGSVSSLETDRTQWEGTITGTLVGDTQFSLTASWREDELETLQDANIQNNDALGLGQTVSTDGSTETVELGGEVLIPVTEAINLTAGARISDQNVAGSATSWSLGGEWTVSESVFVRGSLQQAVRAPNVGELFTSPFGSEVTVGDVDLLNPGASGDPCDERNNPSPEILAICAAQGATPANLVTFQHGTTSLPLVISGNDDLEEETADTFTIGTVIQPDVGDQDLTITLDYWQIDIEDAITTVSGSDVLNRCYEGLENEFCSLISRDAFGNVTRVSSTFLNKSELETSGIDLAVNHSFGIGEGTLSTNASFGYLLDYKTKAFTGESSVDEAGTVNGISNRASDNSFHPELKFTVAPTYRLNDLSVGLRWRYTDRVDDLNDSSVHIPSYSLFDLSASYDIQENVTLSASVSNLGDKEPEEYGGTDNFRHGPYDVVGRFFSVGIKGSL